LQLEEGVVALATCNLGATGSEQDGKCNTGA
jgi:hypothetical protein